MATRHPRGPRLSVSITPEIIARSTRANSKTCMIAEGIRAAFPTAHTVSVDLQTCRFTDPKRGLRYVYLTPRIAQKALLEFDEGKPPAEPFEVVLANAHVTRAKNRKQAAGSNLDQLANAPLFIGQGGASAETIPKKATTRQNADGSVSRLGGRAPAQMKTRRRFGLRAFIGDKSAVIERGSAADT